MFRLIQFFVQSGTTQFNVDVHVDVCGLFCMLYMPTTVWFCPGNVSVKLGDSRTRPVQKKIIQV